MICSPCGVDYSSRPVAIFVVTQRRRGDFLACPACHAEYLRQCEANARDEDRERQQAAARAKRAQERDAARAQQPQQQRRLG